MRTRKQSVMRQILWIFKEHTRVCAVNMRSQNSVRNDKFKSIELSRQLN